MTVTECGIIHLYYLLLLLYLCYTDKYKDRNFFLFTLNKRNEQLKKQDQLIIELKQKLKIKDQESGIVLQNLNGLINLY